MLLPTEIQDHPGQAWDHPKAQAEALVGILGEVGIVDEILVYRSERAGGAWVTPDGHLRKSLDPSKPWPCTVLDLTDAEADYVLATKDPVGQMKEADKAALDALLSSVATGSAAVQEMFADMAAEAGLYLDQGGGQDAGADEARMAELALEWGTAPGQIWVLEGQGGRVHRLVCGDATSEAAWAAATGGETPFMLDTDPPYGVNYDPMWRDGVDLGVGERSKGKVDNDDILDWTAAYRLSGAQVAYVWHAGKYTADVQRQLEDCGFVMRNHIVWVKQHFVISRGDYHWQHEPVWYAVKKGQPSRWCGGRDKTTVWEIANNNSFGNQGHEETYGHGTQKPLECMARPMRHNGAEGDLVADPFLGTGTTLVAAENLGRRCAGIEINPQYVAVVLDRYSRTFGVRGELEGCL